MKKSSLVFSVFGLTALLCSGCSSEPSESDIKQAFDVKMDETIAQMAKVGGKNFTPDMAPELHSVKKIACSEAEKNNGYNCDVEVDLTMPFMGRQKQAQAIRLVKGDDGWIVIQSQ